MIHRAHEIPIEVTPACADRILLALGSPRGVELDTALGDLIIEIRERDAAKVRLNGRSLAAGRRLLLAGDELRYRSHRVRLSSSSSRPALPSGTRTMARAALASRAASWQPHGPCLVVMEGAAAGRRWPLVEGRQRLGRSVEAEIVIPEPSVSRRHAELVVRGETVSIRDLKSRHGLRVGRRRLRGERQLQGGDELVLGSAKLRLLVPELRPAERASRVSRRLEQKLDWWIALGALGLLLLGGAISTLALAS